MYTVMKTRYTHTVEFMETIDTCSHRDKQYTYCAVKETSDMMCCSHRDALYWHRTRCTYAMETSDTHCPRDTHTVMKTSDTYYFHIRVMHILL